MCIIRRVNRSESHCVRFPYWTLSGAIGSGQISCQRWLMNVFQRIKSKVHLSHQNTNLQIVNFQRCKHTCQPLYASCCTVLLYFSRYCTVRLKMFVFCVSFSYMYYLCEKYYTPVTVQYYLADGVSWVPRLTLLELRTHWTQECALRRKLTRRSGTCCM